MASESAGVLIGALSQIEAKVGDRIVKVPCRGKYLAWIPATKKLVIVTKRVRDVDVRNLPVSITKAHRTFHDASPTRASVFEAPERTSGVRSIGRTVSLTYHIPQGLRSPHKIRFRWRHEFGDHGERGHGKSDGTFSGYPEKYMPMIEEDSRGNLFIRRMPGNRFYVSKWIYW